VGDHEGIDAELHRPTEGGLERHDPPLPVGKVPADPPDQGGATDGERLDPPREWFRMVGDEPVRRESDRHLLAHSERRRQERLVTDM
jgi:hypothetical protein